MTKRNQARLLAVLLAALALVLAGSASASATVWKEGFKEVTSPFSFGISGGANYEINSSAGGINCLEHMTLSSTGGSNAVISGFEDKSCKAFGSLKGCTVGTIEAIGLPWTVNLGTSTLSVSNLHVKHKLTGCTTSEIDKSLTVTLTPDSTAGISSFELLGSSGTYLQFGAYTVDSPNAGRYGIG